MTKGLEQPWSIEARHDGSCLKSQDFWKLRWVDPEFRSSRPAWSSWQNPVSTENTKISQSWWQVPAIPATWEAEARESLEARRQRLQCAEIMPLHPSLGDKARFYVSKKEVVND